MGSLGPVSESAETELIIDVESDFPQVDARAHPAVPHRHEDVLYNILGLFRIVCVATCEIDQRTVIGFEEAAVIVFVCEVFDHDSGVPDVSGGDKIRKK